MKKELNIRYQSYSHLSELSSVEQQLFERAKQARLQAYAPYSNFLVGCAVLLENGEIYSGSNQENAAFPSGLCAERTALYWIKANFPTQDIVKVFVIGGPKESKDIIPPIPPCGNCRQSMMEFETQQQGNIEIYFSNLHDEIIHVQSVKDLLPFGFDSSFL